jgi:hypothetical protein
MLLSLVVLLAMIGSSHAQSISGFTWNGSGNFYRGTAYTYSWTQSSTITSVYLKVCDQSGCGGTIWDNYGPISVSGNHITPAWLFAPCYEP